jgi:hypothetical protein
MNTNIEITNIKKHFLMNNDIENNEDLEMNSLYKTKIKIYSFCSINEINICDRIKLIPYYSNYYIIIEDYDYINISNLNGAFIEKLNLKNDNKYLLLKYKNEKLIKFNDFLFNFNNPKMLIFNIIESFSYLLKSLIKLNKKNICFFNLSPQNIGFNLDCGMKPFIYNFDLSLLVSELSEKYIDNIIKKCDDYTHKPLEVHILFYLVKNDILTISYSFIQEICENFVNNLSVLNLFSEKYRETYKELCIESLRKYINKPKSFIINNILEQNEKWDVYSISLLYLHIFDNISRFFSLKHTFINKIIPELLKNIHPEPYKRSSLEELLENHDKLFDNENNWDFVDKIPLDKISKLFEVLYK